MSASPGGLERRYRRLLWAYPGAYRRRHGAEIVTTLLEMAESGHGRPTAGQTLHLVACGIRQRFRLPAGRPLAVVAAVLAAIALGALGTAGGTWLGWRTAASVPSGDEMRTLTAAMAGSEPSGVALYPWQTAMNGPAVAAMRVTERGSYSADRVRTGLTSAGWRITTFTETTGGIVVDITKDPWVEAPTRSIRVAATKDGLSLQGDTTTVVGGAEYGVDGSTHLRVDAWADETAAVRPLTIAGLLLGALAGWLLTAALAYLARRGGRVHRAAVTVLGATALAAAVPSYVLYHNLYRILTYDSGAPSPYIAGTPNGQLPWGWTSISLLALAAVVAVQWMASQTRLTKPATRQ